jgi:hypothetical protein
MFGGGRNQKKFKNFMKVGKGDVHCKKYEGCCIKQ